MECTDFLFSAGDQEAVEGDAGDNRKAIGPGTDDGRELLHERPTPLHGQVEGRGPENNRGRGGTVVAIDRDRPAPTKRRFVTHVRPRGVPRRVARRGPALLVRAVYYLADVSLPTRSGLSGDLLTQNSSSCKSFLHSEYCYRLAKQKSLESFYLLFFRHSIQEKVYFLLSIILINNSLREKQYLRNFNYPDFNLSQLPERLHSTKIGDIRLSLFY